MTESTDHVLDTVAAQIGRRYLMTAEQVITHLAMGDIPHPDAADDDCGATDPRDDKHWCRQPKGHEDGFHNRYPPELLAG